MEYVRGTDLKSGIKQRGALPQRKVAEIAMQVCSALSTAHSQDIIHRDIKPQNIMVQPDGNVKVMDFGIARAKNSVKTQTSSVLGTAHYISPEQAQGKDLTSASDIYSLGCVMYEAATGQLPFDGPDAVSVAMKQVNEKPPAPRAINNDLDQDLEKIIGVAMNKDPKRRFLTSKDMQNALSDYLAGRPVRLGHGGADKTAVISGVAGAAAGAALAGAGMAAANENSPDKTGVMSPQDVQNKAAQQRNFRGAGNTGKQPRVKKKGNGKKRLGITAGIIAGVLVAALVVYFIMFQEVPDVTNLNVDVAKAEIESKGFKVSEDIEKKNDPVVKENDVISQSSLFDPLSFLGFKRAMKGSEIKLVVSLGPEMTKVPDVKGKTYNEAKETLESYGFKVERGDDGYSDKYEKGQVMAQDPEANKQAPKGSTVKLTVSFGTEDIKVPDVVGASESSATSTLKAAGFKVKVNQEFSETVSSGLVISQSPGSGSELAKGGTVTINVSKGENTASVPNIVGQTVGQARAILQGAGFNVSLAGDTADSAIVTSQSPIGGNKVSKNTTITIVGQSKTSPSQ